MKRWKTYLQDERRADTLVQVLFGCMMAVIIMSCLFLTWIAYAKKREMLPNALLMPAGLLMIYAVSRGAKRVVRLDWLKKKKAVWAACALGTLLLQIVMVHSYYFYTDWDVETIVEAAMAHVTGADLSRHENYFSMYPNNLVLVTLFGWIVRLAHILGQAEHAYFALLIFQCVLCWLTGMLLCMLVHRFWGKDSLTAAAWALYQLVVGISPWISIPYSDAVALFFPTAILAVSFLMPSAGVRGIVRLFLLAFLSYFGYRIKPQILIVFMALCLYGAANLLLVRRERKPVRAAQVKGACGFAAGVLCAMLLANTMADDVNVPRNEKLEFGIPHYLMMGMNPEEFGSYAQRDVSFSWRCENRQVRAQQNMEIFWQRVEELGPAGVLRQWVRKTLTNFNDGTFCWAGEGIFYREILEEKNPLLSPVTRSIYYSNTGKAYPFWAIFAQAVWMGVLALCACAVFGRRDARMSVVMLTLIGLTIFETLFEARARYLFCFAPLFIMLAVSGMIAVGAWAKRLRGMRK